MYARGEITLEQLEIDVRGAKKGFRVDLHPVAPCPRRPLERREHRVMMANTMYEDRNMAISYICQTRNISRATSSRYLSLEA